MNFAARADAFLLALPLWTAQLNALAETLNEMGDAAVELLALGNLQDLAEAAALAASAFHNTQAEGLAATPEGGFFLMPSASTDNSVDIFRKQSGAAVLKKSVPATTLVLAVQSAVAELTTSLGNAIEAQTSALNDAVVALYATNDLEVVTRRSLVERQADGEEIVWIGDTAGFSNLWFDRDGIHLRGSYLFNIDDGFDDIVFVDAAGFVSSGDGPSGILRRTSIEVVKQLVLGSTTFVDDGSTAKGLYQGDAAGFRAWELGEDGGAFSRLRVGRDLLIEDIDDGEVGLIVVDKAGFVGPFGGGAPEAVIPDPIDTTIVHVNIHSTVGQSNGIGILTTQVLTGSPPRPGRALMSASGIRQLPNGQNGTQLGVILPREKMLDFADAVEVLVANSGETGLAQMAADMTGTAPGAYPANEACIVQANNISGQPMVSWCPDENGVLPYQFTNMLRAWERFALIANQRKGWSASVGAIHAEFMEQECNQRRLASPEALTDEQMLVLVERFIDTARDYATRFFAAPPPPFVWGQMSNWTHYNVTTYSFPAFFLEWTLLNPHKSICSGPSYDSLYMPDGVHRDASGQRRQYQRHARALQRWRAGLEPLAFYPATLIRSGGNLVATFAGGDGDLAIDTSLVSDPGNLGLTWSGAGAITTITKTGARELTIAGTTGPGTLHFGTIAPAVGDAGPTTGARMCLRDSSTFVGADGDPDFNWCCFRDLTVS